MTFAPIVKRKTWQSVDYREFVRSRPCCVTGRNLFTVAHHVRCLGHGGMGIKPSDWMCVPLAPEEHTNLHAKGEKAYWMEKGLDPIDMVCMTMLVYLAKNPSKDLLESLGRLIEG